MIVVSDTGPLNYLILIESLDILPRLYHEVVIPRAVHEELLRPGAPGLVREAMVARPVWLRVMDAPARDPELRRLGDGEQEAILVAECLKADLLLCDDAEARQAAKRRGLRVTGTLGILQDAADHGFLNLSAAVKHLQKTNFRASTGLIESLRNRKARE